MTQTPPIPATEAETILATARGVIDIEIDALEGLKSQLDGGFLKAIDLIESAKGRLIITGMGKSGLVGRKIAATLSSTGTSAYFLHPAEGSHGDLGLLTKDDTLLAISNSGETPELLNILTVIKRLGVPLIAMTGNPASTLGKAGDAILNIHVEKEACSLNLVPTASTTATLALGDTLAVVLMERRGFTPEDFALFHPSGALGKKLLTRVSDLMSTGDVLPLIHEDTPFLDALATVSAKKLGMGIIVNAQNRLLGVLTDGDVRRALTKTPDARTIRLTEIMTLSPKTIDASELAVTALRLMETHKITVLLTLTPDGQPEGVLHLHDILKTGIS